MKHILISRNWLAVWTAGLLCAAALAPAAVHSQTLTFAGVQTSVGGFGAPAAVAVDANGNVYVANSTGGSVIEIPAAKSTTPANSVIQISSTVIPLGGGFVSPSGIAVDANGNVFVADSGTARIDEIPAGCFTAGCVINLGVRVSNPASIALDRKGNLYVADPGSNEIKEILAVNGSIPAHPSVTTLNGIFNGQGVAVDASGDVFVTSPNSGTIVEVIAVGGVISAKNPSIETVASGLPNPESVAVDANGNLFVSGRANGNGYVEEIEAVDGVIPVPTPTVVTVGHGWSNPSGITLDAKGNLFIADSGNNNGVVEVSMQGPDFGTVNACPAGSVPSASCSKSLTLYYTVTAGGTLGFPSVLGQNAQNADFTVTGTNCTNNNVQTGGLCWVNVEFTPRLAGVRTGAVQVTDANGNPLATTNIHGLGAGPQVIFGPGQMDYLALIPTTASNTAWGAPHVTSLPTESIAVDKNGNLFVVSQSQNALIEIPAVNGKVPIPPQIVFSMQNDTTLTLSNSFNQPRGVAVDASGNVFVADTLNNAVKEILAVNGSIPTSNPVILTVASGLPNPTGIAFDGSGDLFVTNALDGTLDEILAVNGSIPTDTDYQTIRTLAVFIQPFGVAVDGSGNVYVSDTANNAVYELMAVNGVVPAIPTPGVGFQRTANDGIPSVRAAVQTLGSGFSYPQAVTVDAAGDVYVADAGNQALKEILAVNGSIPADNPTILTSPFEIAASAETVDGNGNIFAVEMTEGWLCEIDLADTPAYQFTSDGMPAGATSQTYSTNISNIGNAPLALTTLTVPSGFSQVNGVGSFADCSFGSSLAPGDALCSLSIDFTPEAIGPFSSSVVLTDNVLNGAPATQAIQVSGSAYLPLKTVTYGVAPIVLPARTSSGARITYSIASGPATVSGDTITVTGAGEVQLSAVAPPGSPSGTAENIKTEFKVAPAPLTITADDKTIVYGTQMPTFTGTVTGAVNGDTFVESFSTPISAPVGSYAIVPSVTGNTANYRVTVDKGTLTIKQAVTQSTITPPSEPASAGRPATFLIQVTPVVTGPLSTPPTGTVALYSGGTLAGTATLNNGSCTITATFAASGSYQMTAVYEGDNNYTSSVSLQLTQTVN